MGILILIAIIPLGVSARYDAKGPAVWVIAGFLKIPIYPRKPKKKPKEVPKKAEPESIPQPEPETEPELELLEPIVLEEPKPAPKPEPEPEPEEQPQPQPKQQPRQEPKQPPKRTPRQEKPKTKPAPEPTLGGSWTDFLPLVDVALEALKDLRHKLRLDHFQLYLTLAGEDPCDVAVNSGRIYASMAVLMGQLQNWFVIKKQDVRVDCDFQAEQTLVVARLDVTIRLYRIIALAVVNGWKAWKTYSNIQSQR